MKKIKNTRWIMKQERVAWAKILKIFYWIFFISLWIVSVYAFDINNTNVWDHTAQWWDQIYPWAWNEVCVNLKNMQSVITAEDWNNCSWQNLNNWDQITIWMWNSLVWMVRMKFWQAEFWSIAFWEAWFEENWWTPLMIFDYTFDQ